MPIYYRIAGLSHPKVAPEIAIHIKQHREEICDVRYSLEIENSVFMSQHHILCCCIARCLFIRSDQRIQFLFSDEIGTAEGRLDQAGTLAHKRAHTAIR